MLKNSVFGEKAVSDVVISVSHVSKTYKLYPSHQDRLKEALHPFRKRYHEQFSALSDVTFEIRRGESVGILGRNGAGKSTLLQIIAGVLNPTSGSVRIAGTISALLELGAGFNPDLTGRENVVLANTIQGVGEKEIEERVSLVESFADIGLFFDQPMKVYSSGMYARVAFAHAITVNPDVLIVDEILGVGDAKFQEKCYSRIREMREAGVCILFVSHSAETIQRNCDRALLFDSGKLISEDSTNAVIPIYHNLLYGSQKTDRKPNPLKPDGVPSDSRHSKSSEATHSCELDRFMENTIIPVGQSFNYYNPSERRFGNGGATIIDFLLIVADAVHFDVLKGNEVLTIYMKVKFQRDISKPKIGWAIASTEGIQIAGTNSEMLGVCFNPAKAGEVRMFTMRIFPRLSGGNYFIDLGVGEINAGKIWEPLDNRRALIHLAVADLGRCSGFVEMQSYISVIQPPAEVDYD